MNKKLLIYAICYLVIAVAWGFVAYEHCLDTDLKYFYALIVLTVGFLLMSIIKLYESRKSRKK